MTKAEEITVALSNLYHLTYRCQVNLEAVANRLMQKFTQEETRIILDDIISNLESLDGEEIASS